MGHPVSESFGIAWEPEPRWRGSGVIDRRSGLRSEFASWAAVDQKRYRPPPRA
jgi:hypothetical protein